MSNAHSRCSSSSLKRRALCSASCFEESRAVQTHDTPESDRGTRLHLWMEKLLHGKRKLEQLPVEDADPCRSALEMAELALGDELLPDGTTVNGGTWMAEKRLECRSTAASGYQDWGTVDLIVLYAREMRAVILDWKFGGALIDHPLFNLQLQDYACNLWDSYEMGVTHEWTIEAAYIQPAARDAYSLQPASFSPTDLIGISQRIARIRESAYSTGIVYRVGPACGYCRASKEGTCWAKNAYLSQFAAGTPIASLDGKSPVQIGEILSVVKVVKSECDRIYKLVQEYVQAGNAIPGYSYNESCNRISGSPNLKGMITPEISITRTCANE